MEQIVFHNAVAFAPEVYDAKPAQPQKTVCVASLLMRGGSSAVAAVLDALGIYMGPREDLASGSTYENRAMCSPDPNVWRAEMRRCNDAHDIWGFKSGQGSVVLKTHLPALRNPHVICNFRDPLAQSQRLKHSQKQYTAKSIQAVVSEVLKAQADMYQQFFSLACPRMAVSYGRVIARPEVFVFSLVEFLGLTPSNHQWLAALGRINPTGGYAKVMDNETK